MVFEGGMVDELVDRVDRIREEFGKLFKVESQTGLCAISVTLKQLVRDICQLSTEESETPIQSEEEADEARTSEPAQGDSRDYDIRMCRCEAIRIGVNEEVDRVIAKKSADLQFIWHKVNAMFSVYRDYFDGKSTYSQ